MHLQRLALNCSFPRALLTGAGFVGKLSLALITHGLFFLCGSTPFSPSTALSMNGALRNISIFNVPAAHGVNFGIGFAFWFWGGSVVGDSGCVSVLYIKDLLDLTSYASKFRSSGGVGNDFSSAMGRCSFRGCAAGFRAVRGNVCFGCS